MHTTTILANDIIYNNLYHVNIFQNTHLAAYSRTHMHTPPKSFHPIMKKCHTTSRKKTRGYVNKEIGIQNMKGGKGNTHHMGIHYKDNEIYT